LSYEAYGLYGYDVEKICGSGCGEVHYEDGDDDSCCDCGNTGWGKFEDAGKNLMGSDSLIAKVVDVDPDEDVEKRINLVVKKSIGHVLSEIVKNALDSCGEDSITLDDEAW